MAETDSAQERRNPDGPTDLTKRSWMYVLKRSAREFSRDQCTDVAASLTYYGVLALFPGIIALLSLVSLAGSDNAQKTVDTITGILRDVGAGSIISSIESPLQNLVTASGAAGVAFVVGLLSALWSASGYVGAFGRALNRIYGIQEGRPFWKLRPIVLVVTIVVVVLVAAVMLALVLTGPAATAVGNAIGIGSTAVTIWNIAKWPVMLAAVILVVALLYWATPNIKQPKFAWLSPGAIVAVVSWVIASAAFGFYVANFSSYNKTYGALGGVIAFLLWLWITNLALLFGAELDMELERGRELQRGEAAEETVQLPPRDTRNIEKQEEQAQKDVEDARALRLSAGADDSLPAQRVGGAQDEPSDPSVPAGKGDRAHRGQ